MLWLTDYLAKFLVLTTLCAAGLWCVVALETYRTLRVARVVRTLKRRCRRLLAALRSARSDRDRWRAEAVRWERAYRAAVDHEGEDHPTLPTPILTLVKEEDAPVS